jgi:hypothetical protein
MPDSDADSPVAASQLLDSDAWHECVDARLLRRTDHWEDAAEFRAHGHALRRLFSDPALAIDAVLCVDGHPTACVKDGRDLTSEEAEGLRRRLWNLGATTLLIVEFPNSINAYSTLVKPTNDDPAGANAQLPNETITTLGTVELALRLRSMIQRIETGAIYHEHRRLFDAQSSVDQILLDNLRELRNTICPKLSKRGYQRAHALIGRFLFSCYLMDRHIVGAAYLKSVGLPEAEDMLGLLQAAPGGPRTLARLFEVLQRDFNGSLFGNFLDNDEVAVEDVVQFGRFLSGEDLRTGQLSLFKLYDFGFIPVEFISSIYEDFLAAEANAESASRSGQPSDAKDSQRTQGAYYTPPRLAELTVDVATFGWTTLLDKRCLDPACGSGILLVILFIRMAEEWRKRNPQADTRRRYDELLRLLSQNVRGSDIHLTACLVSCFSLYLAFLDQMEPKEIIELQAILDRDTKTKILPRILWERGKPKPRSPHLSTVRELNFFELLDEREYDLVIGNPPWVSRKPMPAVEHWLSGKANPYLARISKDRSETLFPAREVACAFMWKAGLHIKNDGRVCQILPSRVFLSNNTDLFQSAWIRTHRLETVWFLADWRFILFPTATCPSLVARYHPRRDKEALGSFEFITPKVELLDPRQALILVLPQDQKVLSEEHIVAAADRGNAAAEWKKLHWGTPRDLRLLDRLLRLPRLKRLAKRPPRNPDALPTNRRRWWLKGQGFQPATASTTHPKPVFWKFSDLFIPADAPVLELVLLKENCRRIGNLYRDTGLHRPRSPLIYKPPLVLINKGCTKFLFASFPVLFQDDFQSICAPKHEEDELLFLTAVLSSPLAQYLLFHTTANIGIERDIARLEEILDLPFPLPEDMPRPKESERIMRAVAERVRTVDAELQQPENLLKREPLLQGARDDLYRLICRYYEISEWEQDLISDCVDIFRPSSTPPSLDSENLLTARLSTPRQRKEYADTLVKTFRHWSRTKQHLWAATTLEAGLAVTTLGIGPEAQPYVESSAEQSVVDVLSNIRKALPEDGVQFSKLRGFVLYEPDRVHILKPLSRRHWTRTAALNDADDILGRMMEEDGWRG